MSMSWAITEYRINKKGCECFRTFNYNEAKEKMAQLQARKPNCKFTMQHRSYHTRRNGCVELDLSGKPIASCWMD